VLIHLTNRVLIPVARLTPEDEQALQDLFTHTNPGYLKKRAMNLPVGNETPLIRTWRHDGPYLSVPRGGMYKVRKYLQGANHIFRVQDERTEGSRAVEDFAFWNKVLLVPTLRPYQAAAIETVCTRQNCLIRAPTGSGKTSIAIGLIERLKLPTLVVVWTGALFAQWIDRIEAELSISRRQIGVIKGSKWKLAPITVAMQQSLAAHPDMTEDASRYFGCVIADEVQRFAARTLFDCIDPFAAKYRLGVSANETRADEKECLIYDLFGQVVVDIKKADLIRDKVIHDVEIAVIPTDFRFTEKNRFGMRDFTKMTAAMSVDSARNQLATDMIKAEVAEGHQFLVLSHRVEHCQTLDRELTMGGVRSGVMTGDTGAMFEDTKRGIIDKSVSVAVGTIQAIGTGIDLPAVSRGFIVTPLTQPQLFGQVCGRICRISEGKYNARLYYLWDRHVYGKKALEEIARHNTSVIVWNGAEWQEARAYIQAMTPNRKKEDSWTNETLSK